MIGQPGARLCASPNAGPRRGGVTPDMIVLHYTAIASAAGARDWLCNPEAEVSAHYLIDRDGAVDQLVDEADRAWHAGRGAWGEEADVNSRSIGIELVNTGAEPFPAPQMASLEEVLRGAMGRWAIPPARVLGHSDTAVGRKIDPGPRFDWRRLERQGLAQAVAPGGAGAAVDLATLLHRAGYRWPDTVAGRAAALTALRLRHRPWADGPEDATDRAIAAGLPAAP